MIKEKKNTDRGKVQLKHLKVQFSLQNPASPIELEDMRFGYILNILIFQFVQL